AGGVAIEPVDDPGSLGRASGHAVEEAVDERPFGAPRPGVHHQTGRLVDDQEMVVLEGDAKLHGLLLERSGRRRWLERDLLPTPEAMAFRAGMPIDQDSALGHEPLGRGPGAHLLEAGEEAVETLRGGFGGNADADQERTASPAARRRGRRSAA